jgi:hypothetical protein
VGNEQRACAAFAGQLKIVMRHRYPRQLSEPVMGMAAVAAAQARDELSAKLAGAADAISRERQDPVIERRLEERYFAPARERLGTQRWSAAYAAGSELDVREALTLAYHVAEAARSM